MIWLPMPVPRWIWLLLLLPRVVIVWPCRSRKQECHKGLREEKGD